MQPYFGTCSRPNSPPDIRDAETGHRSGHSDTPKSCDGRRPTRNEEMPALTDPPFASTRASTACRPVALRRAWRDGPRRGGRRRSLVRWRPGATGREEPTPICLGSCRSCTLIETEDGAFFMPLPEKQDVEHE